MIRCKSHNTRNYQGKGMKENTGTKLRTNKNKEIFSKFEKNSAIKIPKQLGVTFINKKHTSPRIYKIKV